MHLQFNSRVATQQLQLKIQGTSGKFIRRLIEIRGNYRKEQLHSRTKKTFGWLDKKTVALQRVKENKIVGSSIGLQVVGDWTFGKVRPPPKREKAQKTAGAPEPLEPLIHSETLTD
jgi:hypothetical protein